MPPIRTLSTAKPIKTERTHEENQERAYIAASRRSDRSLEARIESARRASEIHKRRTGRSLRVTEQDVVNEEMYEEEDDDLPMQYRRLTAHLDTNSADFNRRLAAYLTNHVAMRSALNQAISNSYPDQSQQNQQWSPNNQNMQQPTWPQPSPQYSDGMVPPQMLHRMSTSQSRHQPYPTNYNQRTQMRTNSQSPVETRKPSSSSSSHPSISYGAQRDSALKSNHPHSAQSAGHSPDMQSLYRSPSNGSTQSTSKVPSHDRSETISTIPPPSRSNSGQYQSTGPMSAHYTSYQQGWGPSQHVSAGPLTTAMPLETQMYFGGGDGFNMEPNAFSGPKMQMPVFQDTFNKNTFAYPYVGGMSQTLAPGPMDNEAMNWPTPTSLTESDFSSANNFMYGPGDFDNDVFPRPMMVGNGFASGQITPADNDWSSFINTSPWDENEP